VKPVLYSQRGAQQQEHLLGVVYDLISERGIHAFTMRQVAEASGLSTGTINYYFKNKENLVISALEAAYQLPSDWSQYKGSPSAQLRRLSQFYVFRANSDRWWRFWINCLAASTRDEELQRHENVRFDRQLKFWSGVIADGIAAGQLKAELDPLATARDLLITVHGLLVLQLMKNDPEMRALTRERINQAINELLSDSERNATQQGVAKSQKGPQTPAISSESTH